MNDFTDYELWTIENLVQARIDDLQRTLNILDSAGSMKCLLEKYEEILKKINGKNETHTHT